MLDTKYNHDLVEEGKYEKWLSKNYFKCDENSSKKHFSIILPPPNVTGVLHLGHAYDVTLQDIIIRYKKMEGYGFQEWIMRQLQLRQKLLKD